MTPSPSATGALLLLSVIWGSTWIANGMMPEQDAPLHTALFRYGFSWIFLGVACGAQLLLRRAPKPAVPDQNAASAAALPHPQFDVGRALDLPARKDFAWVGVSIVLGLTMFGMPDLLLVWAARHGAAAWTPLIYAGLPLGLLLTAGELSGAAILGIGAMLVLLNGSFPLTAAKLTWALLIAAAVALQGWSLMYAKRHLAAASSLLGCMVQLMTAFWTLLIAIRLWPEGDALPLKIWRWSSLDALLVLAGLATAFAYPLYYRLLEQLEPAQLATTAWLQTPVAVGESAVLLRQTPGWPMICAACVLVGCTLLLLRRQTVTEQTLLRLSS